MTGRVIQIGFEPWPAWHKEAEVLFRDHWREVGRDRDRIPLDIDWPLYQVLHDTGRLICTTARGPDRALVGYSVWFLRPHPHYRSSLWLANDVLYLVPAWRRVGQAARLITAALEETRRLVAARQFQGAVKVTMHAKVEHDFWPLAERLGFERDENVYGRLL